MTGISVLMVSLRKSGALHYTAMQGRSCGGKPNSGSGILRPRKAMLIRGGSGCARLGFVGAGAVKARNGNAEQAVIHRELRAMMDVVIQDHSPNAGHARQVENFL